MTTKLAKPGPLNGMHTAGIFADMTVDGPEIGTLVVIVDRAKNLPNRKTMGKQDPYCAARLGKEAKKTGTDRRGGQTPRWDQELRFTVHESPDYNNLKVSVFNDDKKTELIGEAWINLDEVIKPGGGQNDLWHPLNCRGKFAGEIRLEMTYYDTRPKIEKPERRRESGRAGVEDGYGSIHGPRQTPVKRRPLPSNPASAAQSPAALTPDNARPSPMATGPRAYEGRARGGSVPPEHFHALAGTGNGRTMSDTQYSGYGRQREYSPQQQDMYADPYGQQQSIQMMPDLPEIPPSSRQRRKPLNGRLPDHVALPHSHSAPAVPTTYDTQYEEQDLDVHPGFPPQQQYSPQEQPRRHWRDDVPPAGDDMYMQQQVSSRRSLQPMMEEPLEVPPPLPPSHRNSAPSLTYGSPHGTSPGGGRQSIPQASPLQSIEREYGYGTPGRAPPSRGRSEDNYTGYEITQEPFEDPAYRQDLDSFGRYQGSNGSPQYANRYSHPSSQSPGYGPGGASPLPPRPTPRSQQIARHSMPDPYNTATPPRAHPLTQEMRRSASPAPYYPPQQSYYNRDAAPLIKPRAISPTPRAPSPLPPQPRSSLSAIQHPVQTFATSQSTPNLPNLPIRNTPTRKSVSPRPSTGLQSRPSTASVPFSPDSFDTYNPSARSAAASLSAASPSPHNPYHIPASPKGAARSASAVSATPPHHTVQDGPIVDFHGRVIDPSDHLPVDSWAPEPEKKNGNQAKRYEGRSSVGGGVAGPRTTPGAGAPRPTVTVNVRTKADPEGYSPSPSTSTATPGGMDGRNRLLKKSPPPSPAAHAHSPRVGAGARSPVIGSDGPGAVLREIDVPNPYAQSSYSSNFAQGSPGIERGGWSRFGGSGADKQGMQMQNRQGQQYQQGGRSPNPNQGVGGGFGGGAAGYGAGAAGAGYDGAYDGGYDGGYEAGYEYDDYGYGSAGAGGGRSPGPTGFGGRGEDVWRRGGGGGGAPQPPPKVPLDGGSGYGNGYGNGYGVSALSKEIASIDLGGSRTRPRGVGTRRGY